MRKRSLILIGFTVVVLGTLLVACVTVPTPTDKNFQAPVVTLNSVEMPYYTGWWYYDVKVKPTKGEAGKYGAPLALAFIFDIQNPNAYPVMMDGLKFTIAFDGIDVNTVNSPEVQWIPAGKTNQVRVMAITDARAALLSLLVTGGFKLKEKGTNVWAQLENWWLAAKDYSLSIEVKEGSAIFKADGKMNVAGFSGTFAPE
ncbi:MAG: LEA type 2 family protein [Desulfobacteria bacterium]